MGSSAQLLRYIALGLIPISIVEPIHRTSVIFRVIFGFIINRNHEIINLRVLLGVALSITADRFLKREWKLYVG